MTASARHPAMRYKVTSGSLTVTARSRVHDTKTVWHAITGEIDADAERLASDGASATFSVDMTAFDAGDWLKNRKLRSDFAMDDHPLARFTLSGLSDVVRDGPTFTANADGQLAWRGKTIPITFAGRGRLDAASVEASATGELDIKRLGLSAPRFLLFKMEDEVAIVVHIRGAAV